jgi:hypothetical protein
MLFHLLRLKMTNVLIARASLVASLKCEIAQQLPSTPVSCDSCRHSVFHHTYLHVIPMHISVGLGII